MVTVDDVLAAAGNMVVTVDNKLITMARILVAAGNMVITNGNSYSCVFFN